MTKNMVGRNNASYMLPLLFALLITACLPTTANTHEETKMITLNKSVWQLIEDIQTLQTLTLTTVEKILEQSLSEDSRKSNEFFKFYSGQSIELAANSKVTSIDFRLPLQGAQSRGMLLMYLDDECISLPQIKRIYPDLEITNTPRGRSLEEATTYTATNAWGETDFGFQEKKPDCLGYIILKPGK